MPVSDYHTHTPLCLHAEGTPGEYVDAAVSAGLEQYGISDHAPMPEEPFDQWRMKQSDLPAYLDWIAEARNHAVDTPLEILAGLECDWIPGIEPWIRHLRSLHPWDYLIGSVHYLHGKTEFDNPDNMAFWKSARVEEAWEEYWRLYADMAHSSLFDIMGHADLIRKFGHKPRGDLKRYYLPAIEAIAGAGAIVEINTAGWYKTCGEQYPSLEFLELACEAGIPLVVNSDAHSPGEVARDIAKGIDTARQAGYRRLVKLGKGGREFYPI